MLYVQIIGRALRTAHGKDAALILDHSDTTQRLGFVTDIHRDCLDDGKPQKKDARAEKKRTAPERMYELRISETAEDEGLPNCGHETKIVSEIMKLTAVSGMGCPARRRRQAAA